MTTYDSLRDQQYGVEIPQQTRMMTSAFMNAGAGVVPYVQIGAGKVAILYKVLPSTREALQLIAHKAGYAGNVTQLLEAIGQGLLVLSVNPNLFEQEEEAVVPDEVDPSES